MAKKTQFAELSPAAPSKLGRAAAWLLLSATRYEDGEVGRKDLDAYLDMWNRRTHYALLDTHGGLVAAASVQPDTSPLYIARFAVQPHARRQGYGRLLMRGIAEHSDAPTLRLLPKTDLSRDIFGRMGFTDASLHDYMDAPVAAIRISGTAGTPAPSTPQLPEYHE